MTNKRKDHLVLLKSHSANYQYCYYTYSLDFYSNQYRRAIARRRTALISTKGFPLEKFISHDFAEKIIHSLLNYYIDVLYIKKLKWEQNESLIYKELYKSDDYIRKIVLNNTNLYIKVIVYHNIDNAINAVNVFEPAVESRKIYPNTVFV